MGDKAHTQATGYSRVWAMGRAHREWGARAGDGGARAGSWTQLRGKQGAGAVAAALMT